MRMVGKPGGTVSLGRLTAQKIRRTHHPENRIAFRCLLRTSSSAWRSVRLRTGT